MSSGDRPGRSRAHQRRVKRVLQIVGDLRDAAVGAFGERRDESQRMNALRRGSVDCLCPLVFRQAVDFVANELQNVPDALAQPLDLRGRQFAARR